MAFIYRLWRATEDIPEDVCSKGGDIRTQIATLNVNMTLGFNSHPLPPPRLT